MYSSSFHLSVLYSALHQWRARLRVESKLPTMIMSYNNLIIRKEKIEIYGHQSYIWAPRYEGWTGPIVVTLEISSNEIPYPFEQFEDGFGWNLGKSGKQRLLIGAGKNSRVIDRARILILPPDNDLVHFEASLVK